MERLLNIIHWSGYAYYVYIFSYAALLKILQKPSMMQSMASLGFNDLWTITIGAAETIGVLFVLYGLYDPRFKNGGILFLSPFAIGALTAHMAY